MGSLRDLHRHLEIDVSVPVKESVKHLCMECVYQTHGAPGVNCKSRKNRLAKVSTCSKFVKKRWSPGPMAYIWGV